MAIYSLWQALTLTPRHFAALLGLAPYLVEEFQVVSGKWKVVVVSIVPYAVEEFQVHSQSYQSKTASD